MTANEQNFERLKSILKWLPPGAWMAVLLYYSVVPVAVTEPGGVGSGLDPHLPAYFLLSILSFRLFSKERGPARAFLAAVLFSTAYGLLMEVAQLFLPGRFFAVGDMLTNLAGSSLAVFLVPLVYEKSTQSCQTKQTQTNKT